MDLLHTYSPHIRTRTHHATRQCSIGQLSCSGDGGAATDRSARRERLTSARRRREGWSTRRPLLQRHTDIRLPHTADISNARLTSRRRLVADTDSDTDLRRRAHRRATPGRPTAEGTPATAPCHPAIATSHQAIAAREATDASPVSTSTHPNKSAMRSHVWQEASSGAQQSMRRTSPA